MKAYKITLTYSDNKTSSTVIEFGEIFISLFVSSLIGQNNVVNAFFCEV